MKQTEHGVVSHLGTRGAAQIPSLLHPMWKMSPMARTGGSQIGPGSRAGCGGGFPVQPPESSRFLGVLLRWERLTGEAWQGWPPRGGSCPHLGPYGTSLG